MPGEFHEALVKVVQDRPEFGGELLRKAEPGRFGELKVVGAVGGCTSVGSVGITERRADNLIVLELDDGSEIAVIVEIQNAWSEDKYYRLPGYIGRAFEDHRCSVEALVVCPSDDLAARFRKGIHVGDMHWVPVQAVGPTDMPLIEDADQDGASAESAVMAALLHRRKDLTERQLSTIDELLRKIEPGRASDYALHLCSQLNKPSSELLEAIMKTMTATYHSAWSDQLRSEGREEARRDGIASLRTVLFGVAQRRRIELSAPHVETISESEDVDQLQRWIANAAVAAEAEEIFREEQT
ncbi:hypothetical protein [Salininema proteolyticum]|uniref:Uncharacterized protein n=1 Tax=Salininema proteolyticum TaxID=1607685 RepID=A0ABV8U454_9ACTN